MGVGGLAAALARAGQQHGVITLAQLADHDVSRQQLRTAVTGGLLIPIAPRVYAAGGSAATTRAIADGAGCCASAPTPCSATSRAARLHDFDRCLPDVVELTLPRRRRGVRSPFVVHTTAHWSPVDRVVDRRMAVHVGHPHRHRPGPGPCRTEAPRGGHRQRRAIGGERTTRVGQAARADPGSWPVGRAATRRAARRRRWAHHARARLPGPDASWRPPPTDDPARPPSRRTNRRPRRLLLRAPSASSSRCRAVAGTARRPSGPETPSGATSCRTSAARSTSSRGSRSPAAAPRCKPSCGHACERARPPVLVANRLQSNQSADEEAGATGGGRGRG